MMEETDNLDSIVATSMFITKTTLSDGLMKWSAVNSDTDKDLYGESMSLELYRKMLSYIRNEVPPPDAYKSMVCSDFWCGGMPYVSLAHYPDLNGKAVPGQPLELFIDGKQLKARGVMFDTQLGRAVWKSLKQDENLPADENRIRISIAFLDLAHKHGEDGATFHRKSTTSVCPQCLEGVGNKIYLDGYLVHLALTRVPVNPRTLMEEDIMAKKSIQTRKEDAVSIVGDEALVDEIVKSALEIKSEVMVEMSDAPVEDVIVEEAKAKKEDMPEDDVEDSEGDDAEMKDKKKGKAKCSLTEGDFDVIRSMIAEVLPKVDTVSEVKKSVLDLATDELYNSVNVALSLPSATLEARLESINPALQELGNSITALVRESMGTEVPTPQANETGMVLEAVTTLAETVKALANEVATMKAQTVISAPVVNKMPVPRSIQPSQLVTQSQAVEKPNSVANIVRRTVSSQLAPVNR